MPDLLQPFELEFMQRAAAEMLLLSGLAGLLGAQIVLRGLAFFTHSVGTATFPGLVAADPLGIPPVAAALAVAGAFAAVLERLGRATRLASDAATALLLAGALAAGVVLASDVFESGAQVDSLLFGTLLAIGDAELAFTAIALGIALAAAAVCRRTWIAAGFDAASSRAQGLRVSTGDRILLAVVALAVVACLDAIGALLVASILVIPAATARLVTSGIATLELTAAGIALAEGLTGLLVAYELDVPPGATIAALSGSAFAVVAAASRVWRSTRREAAA